jgi:cytochrome c oxidase subunit 4
MAETPHTEHHGPDLRLYLTVAAALAVFTASSFAVNALVRSGHFSGELGFVLILGVAIAKAVLVGMFFMHLKFDWGNVYFIIVPISILGVTMMVVLLPDIVLAWL